MEGFPPPAPKLKKRTISISHGGKSLLKVYGNANEIKTFFNSVQDKDEKIATSFFDGEDVIQHKTTDVMNAMGSYEKEVGKSFRELQKSLGVDDAGSGGGDYPSRTPLESYEDRLNKTFRDLHNNSVAAPEVEYPSLSSVSSYENKYGKLFRQLKMKLSTKSSSAATLGDVEVSPPVVEDPPSPVSAANPLSDLVYESQESDSQESDLQESDAIQVKNTVSWGKNSFHGDHQETESGSTPGESLHNGSECTNDSPTHSLIDMSVVTPTPGGEHYEVVLNNDSNDSNGNNEKSDNEDDDHEPFSFGA